MKKVYVGFLIIVALFLVTFINSIVGNPLYKSLATSYAKQFVATQFTDGDYKIETVGFNFDTKMYDYIVKRQTAEGEYAYELTIQSKLSDRIVSSFSLHPSLIDEALSEKLSNEGKIHVANIVHQLLEGANVTYKVTVPKGKFDSNTVWSPGFALDLNAVIQINETVQEWDAANYTKQMEELKDLLAQNGINYSRLSIRVTKENLKDGITYIKTVYKNELYASEG